MKNMEYPNTILAQKIAKLVKYFYNDCSVYMQNYDLVRGSEINGKNKVYDTSDNRSISSHDSTGNFFICAGDFFLGAKHERWISNTFKPYDIISFSTVGNGTLYTTLNGDECIIDMLYDSSTYTEEYLFQQSLVLPSHVYDTLELYLELKKCCDISFKLNLSLVDVDEGISLYEN